MPKFEHDILGLIPQTDWLNVGFDVTRQNDPVDGLFGDQRTENLVAEWESIASEYQIPAMAMFHGFDTEAQTTVRVPIDAHNIEKGLIKVKINQSERLRALLGHGVRNDALYDYVMDDGINLAEQVFTRSKVAKNELLATGKITIEENGLDLEVDYGVPAGNVDETLDTGAGAQSDLTEQIQDIVDHALASGVELNGLYCSRKLLQAMRANESIQIAINGTYGAGALVRMDALKSFLEEEYGISKIITNDQYYSLPRTISAVTGKPTGVTRKYYPETKATFFQTNNAGRLGVGLWGNPPEMDGIDLLGFSSAEYPYVYISQWQEKDPAVIWTKASALFMPVLYNPNSLFIATVSATPKNQ